MRSLLALFCLTLLVSTPCQAQQKPYAPAIGIQTWTCRNLSFEAVVDFAKEHEITQLQMIAKHLDPKASPEEWAKRKAVLEENGLSCYTFGVARTSSKTEENRKLFEMAKYFGCKLIVVEPNNDKATWDSLESLVKEYDIRLAIHNHGKGSRYGNPETVKKVLAERDARIGVCLDVGWVTAAGYDAAKVFEAYEGRVFDIHLKDKKLEQAGDKTVTLDVEVGAGDANYASLFAALSKAKWKGVLAIETDNGNFAKNPKEFVEVAQRFVAASFRDG